MSSKKVLTFFVNNLSTHTLLFMSSRSNLVVSRLLQATYDDTSSTRVLYRGCCNLSSAEKGGSIVRKRRFSACHHGGLRRQLESPERSGRTRRVPASRRERQCCITPLTESWRRTRRTRAMSQPRMPSNRSVAYPSRMDSKRNVRWHPCDESVGPPEDAVCGGDAN